MCLPVLLAEPLAAYTAQAGAPASPERGQKFFDTYFKRDLGWRCATCHGAVPIKPASTS